MGVKLSRRYGLCLCVSGSAVSGVEERYIHRPEIRYGRRGETQKGREGGEKNRGRESVGGGRSGVSSAFAMNIWSLTN